jgi:hypothetical protein
MIADGPILLGSGVTYSATVPFQWLPKRDRDEEDARHLHESNEEVLRLIISMDEHPLTSSEDHGDNQDMARVDFKLNLLLDLVGQLVTRHLDLPRPRSIDMNSVSMAWTDDHPPTRDAEIEIEVYLSPKYPRAVTLRQPARQELEKIIVRQHRRDIAHSRRSAPDTHNSQP